MITRFQVRNYKCLQDIDIPLTPIHVLIGPNDAGKSSALEAMQQLHFSTFLELVQEYGPFIPASQIYSDSSSPTISLGATCDPVDLPPVQYSLDLEYDWQAFRRVREKFIQGNGKESFDDATEKNRTAVCRRKHGEVIGGSAVEVVARQLREAHLHKLNPSRMGRPCPLDMKWRYGLEEDGFGLAGLLDETLGTDVDRFRAIRDEFCKFFPQYEHVQILTQPGGRRRGEPPHSEIVEPSIGKGIAFTLRGGRTISANQASDGAILFLGFLALLRRKHRPSMLLLEEPENGIYPARIQQVLELLRELLHPDGSEGTQTVITTHSPYVLSHFTPDEVTYFSRGKDGVVRARPLRDAPHIQERVASGFNLGELWYNLTEEELFGE